MIMTSSFSLDRRTRPILKWAGGKSHILKQLIPHFPTQFKRYIEPFLGGGAAFFALEEGKEALLNDCNSELYNLYRVVKEKPQRLMDLLDSYRKKYSEKFYYEMRSKNPRGEVQAAARTLFLNKTGFNGLHRKNLKGDFNVPFGKRISCPKLYDRENLMRVSNKLQTSVLFNKDFEEVIHMAEEGDFVYCDPPYEPLSATSSFTNYTGLGFSRKDQLRLYHAIQAASQKGVHVAVSNSSAEFILNTYSDFKVHRILARRAINSNAAKRGVVEEVLIISDFSSNF